MKKKKGFTSLVNKPRYEVLKLLQQDLSISEISKIRRVSRTSIYKVLSTLTKKGLISKVDRGVYKLTEEGQKGLHSFVGLRNQYRQHNLHFKLKILSSPKNWNLKRNELRQLPYYNKTISLKNNEQDLFNYGKLQIKTTTKSIIIKMPTMYAKDYEHCIVQSMGILENVIPKIENLFKVKLIKDYKSSITIISQEYAKLQDALAKLYRREGSRLYISGDDGKIWMITDFSFSVDETEFIHSSRATDDIDAIAPFMNDLRKNPTTLSEVREETREMVEVAKMHSVNITKHQGVLDKIYEQMLRLEKRLNDAGV